MNTIHESVGGIATAGISSAASVALTGSAMLREQGWKGAATGIAAGYSAAMLLRIIIGGSVGAGTTLLLMGIGATIGVLGKEE